MQIKIVEKQPKKNLEISIILLYYYNINSGTTDVSPVKGEHIRVDRYPDGSHWCGPAARESDGLVSYSLSAIYLEARNCEGAATTGFILS